MNTVKSFWIGWGSLIIAGGGAYYYAKREIDASRREKFRKLQAQQQLNANLEFDSFSNYPSPARGSSNNNNSSSSSSSSNYTQNSGDLLAASPSAEASSDPAPTGHDALLAQSVGEKSRYEAAVPYRNRKGDRFS